MSGNSGSGEIDILSPSGTSGGVDSDEPLFEEVDIGTYEGNQTIEERAAEGHLHPPVVTVPSHRRGRPAAVPLRNRKMAILSPSRTI